jgi:C1A family cysteine protease
MKNAKKGLAAALAAVAVALSLGGPAFAQSRAGQIKDVQDAIRRKGARWVAGETSVSNLSEDEWRYKVGLNFTGMKGAPVEGLSDRGLPRALDWRDNGGDYVTPVRDQKKCGGCWAFSMTGGLESYVLRSTGRPGRDLNLSEQVMISCSGVGSCDGGTLNADYLESTGLPEESAYPYTGSNGTCSSAAQGWQDNTYTIGSWGSVPQSVSSLKAALAKYGPLPTAFMVYEDFMHYKSGVYSYTTGKKLGGHAVLLVGYDDNDQAFIVKNSWNTGWGENGFFRIAYSELTSPVSFGLSTIAYKAPSKGEADLKRQASAGGADTWARVAPMFETAAAWN